jgi:hypothetical protein
MNSIGPGKVDELKSTQQSVFNSKKDKTDKTEKTVMDYWTNARPISLQANHRPTIGFEGAARNANTAAGGQRR